MNGRRVVVDVGRGERVSRPRDDRDAYGAAVTTADGQVIDVTAFAGGGWMVTYNGREIASDFGTTGDASALPATNTEGV